MKGSYSMSDRPLIPAEGHILMRLEGALLALQVKAGALAQIVPGEDMMIRFDKDMLLSLLEYMEEMGQTKWIMV